MDKSASPDRHQTISQFAPQSERSDAHAAQAERSIACQIGYNNIFRKKPNPMKLFWSEAAGMVRLVRYDTVTDGPIETELFNVPANSIKRSVIADGSTTLILTLPNRRYKLFLGEKALDQTRYLYPVMGNATMIAGMFLGSIESRIAGLYDFQNFLAHQGVKTKRSGMLHLIVWTVLIFVLILSMLIGVLAVWAK